MYSKIRSLISWISTLAWPAKLAIGAFVGAATAGGVLTFLLQNAAYGFALTYGFRPPVEGVPYVAAIVGVTSLVLPLAGAVLAVVITIIARMTPQIMEGMDKVGGRNPQRPSVVAAFRTITPREALVVIPILSTLIAGAWSLLPAPRSSPIPDVCSWPLLLCSNDVTASLPFGALLFICAVILLTVLWRPNLVFFGAAGIVLLYYGIVAVNVLPAEGYGRLLRLTDFGGGLGVVIELTDESGNGSRQTVNANLLMRSASSIVVYDDKRETIDEYPLARVWKVSHKQGGLKRLAFRLPPTTSLLD
jgi:hypothetical protein